MRLLRLRVAGSKTRNDAFITRKMGKIIGTAGHVDHGKTELIKALTGIDTDRLAEEKERGLTIDLGFAYIDLKKSGRIGIIDVPGHEKFMKNMLAGVGGMDIVILVVAANESVMPQTREHFHIMRLLGVKDMIIGISKIDMVDKETCLIVREEIKDLIKDTAYQDVPIIEFSSVTDEGISEIRKVLDEKIYNLASRASDDELTRLAIDRCFELKGIGTVITGTLLSGSLKEGDDIVILPDEKKTKARQIQEHNQRKSNVSAGERVAINLPGVDKKDVERGDIITKQGQFKPTDRLLVYMDTMENVKRIKDMTRVRLYLGSGEFLGRLELIGKRKVTGGECFVSYIALEKEIIARRKDRFIFRRYSPMDLLGGGLVLDAFPEIRKRFSSATLERTERLVNAKDEDVLLYFMNNRHLNHNIIRERMQMVQEKFEDVCSRLVEDNKIVIVGNEIFAQESYQKIRDEIVKRVKEFHSKNPLKRGMDKENLRSKLGLLRDTFDDLISPLESVEMEKSYVKVSGFNPQFDEKTAEERKKILKSLKEAQFKPQKLEDSDLVRNLVYEGLLVKVKEGLYFHKDAVEMGKKLIKEAINQKGPLGVSELKEELNTTRKYIIPFLEYLDSKKFTLRKGDVRVLYDDE
jgi:selenocysteine-specific elongation factor